MKLNLQVSVQKVKLFLASILLFAISNAFAQALTIGGTGSSIETFRKLGEAFSRKDARFQYQILPSIGSSGAAKGLINRNIDIGLMSRPLKKEEESTALRSLYLAQTPLVLATSRSSEKSMTRNQLEDIYSGKSAVWPDGRRVRLVLRSHQDTEVQLLSKVSVALGEALKIAYSKEGMTVGITDQEAAHKLENLPDSLGTTTLSLLLSEQRRLTMLSLDGISPMIDGKANARYPLQKKLYVVTPVDANPALQRFVQFIQSQEGIGILEKNGFLYEQR